MRRKKIFITGGTGFIGKFVVDQLIRLDYIILLLSRKANITKNPQIKIIRSDLENISKWQNKLKNFKPDFAIHLAWEGLPDHSAYLSKLNLDYGLNLTKILAEIGCKKIIITGSCWEYGYHSGEILSEDTCPAPFDPFTAAKHSLHLLGAEIAKEKGMEFIWTRLFYVYGPGQHYKSLIPHILNSIHQGKKPEIRNPKGQNDFIYVKDVAIAICKLLNKTINSNTYNIGSGKLTSIDHILGCVLNNYGIKNEYEKAQILDKDKFSSNIADISKIKRDIGWKPNINLNFGIRSTVNEFQKKLES